MIVLMRIWVIITASSTSYFFNNFILLEIITYMINITNDVEEDEDDINKDSQRANSSSDQNSKIVNLLQ